MKTTEVAPSPTPIRALLSGLIDYAGMFPPASLSLEDALNRYVVHLTTPESWIVARFICPVARLDELVRVYATSGHDAMLRVSVLLSSPETVAKFDDQLKHNLEKAVRADSDARISVEAFELRLPDWLASSREAEITDLTTRVLDRIRRTPINAGVYFEAPKHSDLPQATSAMVAALAQVPYTSRPDRPGLKFRCGGESSTFFPDAPSLASAIHTALGGEVPFKATAGLHHPFGSYNRGLGTWMHGFVNVFAAAAFGVAYGLTRETLEQILLTSEPDDFTFTERHLRWRDLQVATEEIVSVRRDFAVSFGSCSVEEPIHDLRTMGLL